jgi:hypothetical protein
MLGQIQHNAHIVSQNKAQAVRDIVYSLLLYQLAEPASVVIGLIFPVVEFAFLWMGTFGWFRNIVLGKFGNPCLRLIRGKKELAAIQW